MAKALRIAAIVVAIAAFAIPVVGQIVGTAALAGALGVSAATLATIATALQISAAVLSVAAGLMARPPSFGSTSAGQQLDFIADPQAGEPYVMGDARVGMDIVHEASWGSKNKYLGMIGVISCAGPIMAYDGLYADNTLIGFSGRNATGYYQNFMYLDTQLGARPEATALDMTSPVASAMPDWDASSKLSSLAAAGILLVADTDKGKIYSGGVPRLTNQVKGVFGYDPRLDSTNGGTGTQRPGGIAQDETDYAYSENPWVHAGTYALGRWVEGVKVIGPGLPADKIDWPSYIEAANIADANGWTVSGRIMSTDRKWNVLKSIAQAGGGYPIPTGAKLGALVNAPKVSLETIEETHLKGPVSVPQMSMRRSRLNGGIPRFREPSQAWEVVSGDTIRSSAYLAADNGNPRTKEIDLPLVADKDQAAQLAGYEIANSRERSPITVELDLHWSQYKMGDCLTLNLPSALLFNQKCVIIGRSLDATKNTVTFQFRTETDGKHAWALGLGGGVPSATVGSSPGSGDVGSLTNAQIVELISTSSVVNSDPSTPVLTASETQIFVKTHYRRYSDDKVSVDGNTGGALLDEAGQPILDEASDAILDEAGASSPLTGLTAGTLYHVGYEDPDRLGGAVTYVVSEDPYDVTNQGLGGASPYMHYVGSITTAGAGSGTTTSGGVASPPGYSGGGFGALP